MNLDIICKPLGQFLYFIYNTVAFHNYGFAIIIFTVLIKLLLFPLTVKQLKSTAKQQKLQPQMAELQKKYKNDKERLNQELMKFYKENNFNPAAGCFPMMIQLPIIISLYWVIVQPIKFMLGKNVDTVIKPLGKLLSDQSFVHSIVNPIGIFKPGGLYEEIGIMKYLSGNIKNSDIMSQVSQYIKPSEVIHMNFPTTHFGLNLADIPTYDTTKLFGPNAASYWAMLIIPILAVITTYFSTKMSMPQTSTASQTANSPAMPNMKFMVYFAPVMTAMFAFQFPLGLALYWTTGYIFQICQQLFVNKYIHKKKEGVV